MKFKTRSYEKELLDRDDIPFSDIIVNMRELNVINTLLGGHKITCHGVGFFLKQLKSQRHLSIAEAGCGGGDNLAAIHKYLLKKNCPHSLTGIDLKKECINFARQNAPANIEWILSDYRKVKWPGEKPDIIFTSLFCHHFTDDELVEQLKWLKENSRIGYFINDLERNPLAYYSIKILTRLFSRSHMVKNDAPLSVLRGFKKSEWVCLFERAGITDYTIKWKWAFRHLKCVGNGHK